MESSRALLRRPAFALECFKLLISLTASGVIAHEILVGTNLSHFATVYVTLMGFPLVQIVVIMSELLKTPLHRVVTVTVNAAGCAMYIASAAVMFSFLFGFSDWQYLPGGDRLLAAAVLAVFDAAFCLVSLVLAAKGS